jgi:succinoglycan biosynthesis protein ExoU
MASGAADVCVIIPAHNARSTVVGAVSSALAQPEAAEIVVMDDASRDGTAEAVRGEFGGCTRVRLIRVDENGGPSVARNLGIQHSSAPWIVTLDADDRFLPDRLALLRAQSDGWDFVADDLWRDHGSPETEWSRLIGSSLPLPSQLRLSQFVRANISRRSAPRRELGFLKPLMRRAFLEDMNLSYDERLRLGEDFILYAQALALGGRFKLVGPCGYLTIERENSLSTSHGAQELEKLAAASNELLGLCLSPQDRAAVRAHTHHVNAKLQLRRVLDSKQRGLGAATLQTAVAPQHLPYVLIQGGGDAIGRRMRRVLRTDSITPQLSINAVRHPK